MSLDRALEALVASEPFERLLLERARPILAHADAGEDAVVAALARALDAPVLAVAPGPREAEVLAAGVAAYLGEDRVALLPAWEALPYEGIGPTPEIAARRADAIHRLRGATGSFVVVAPALAAQQGLIPTLGSVPPLDLVAGRELAPDALAERLVELGYTRADVVEHRGEFAVRGGVVDVFAGDARRPVRREDWGDRIESLREFSPSTQLSTAKVARVLAPAVRELIPDDDLRALAGRRAQLEADRFRDGLQRLADGLFVEGAETLAPFVFDHMPTVAELLPRGAWIVLTQVRRTQDRARQVHEDAEALAQAV
ncbi:MAG: transcription-repair coupling factor, partial [Actinomycetota bacterium]